MKRWLINFYSPPGATALDKEKPLILLVLYKCASSCGCWTRHKPDRGFMNDARVGKSRRCESVNTVPLLLHFFFFPFFFILLLLKNNNHRRGITTMQSTAPFYDGQRCKTPPFSHSQSEWFLCTPWHVCNAVDRISNGVICEEDIMRYCVRPVYTTYANTNRHCLRFVFPRRHQCFWNEADSKHFLFVTLEVLMPPSLQEQTPRPLLES